MKFLVDTHAFLWCLMTPTKLGRKARRVLLNPANTIFLSTISLWEISLKFSLGKLDLQGVSPEALPHFARQAGFQILPLNPLEAATFHHLPKLVPKDPFDRMLIWQCLQNGCALISKDTAIQAYKSQGLPVIW